MVKERTRHRRICNRHIDGYIDIIVQHETERIEGKKADKIVQWQLYRLGRTYQLACQPFKKKKKQHSKFWLWPGFEHRSQAPVKNMQLSQPILTEIYPSFLPSPVTVLSFGLCTCFVCKELLPLECAHTFCRLSILATSITIQTFIKCLFFSFCSCSCYVIFCWSRPQSKFQLRVPVSDSKTEY